MRQLWIVLAMLLIVAAGAAGFLTYESATRYHYYADVFKDPRPAVDFTLTDQDGKELSLHDLRGKLVLMAFGFTHCPNVCPTTLADLAIAYQSLPTKDQKRVKVLFVSVDPDRDTPQALAKYVPFFDKSFVGLTGPKKKISQTIQDYGGFYQLQYEPGAPAGADYTVNHSAYTYVIGPKGKWIALYDYSQINKPTKIADDLKHWLR